MIEALTVNHKVEGKGITPLGTLPRDSQRQEGEIGVQIQKGVIGEEGAKKDIEIIEISTQAHAMEDVTVGTTALIEVKEESHLLIDIGEENIAQGKEEDRKDMETGKGKSILQMKTGGTLATGEGGAKGP